MTKLIVHLLDYGAGNVQSVVNAINALGYPVQLIRSGAEFVAEQIQVLVFPGVGSFGAAMEQLNCKGLVEPLRSYIREGKPYLGICIGMQVLFSGSEESRGVEGLGIFPQTVCRLDSNTKSVPHIGWNHVQLTSKGDNWLQDNCHFYFVHSFAVPISKDTTATANPWVYASTQYGDETFVSAIQIGLVYATQFHPEKSGTAGLELLGRFLSLIGPGGGDIEYLPSQNAKCPKINSKGLTRRIIACLDVRSNDCGELVVTKGDQYDVRDKDKGAVRNLGSPVELAREYYQGGADEIVLLNITSFRNCPLQDFPMISVLQELSKHVFVPLTIGGGIRDINDETGKTIYSALDIADIYFRSGADKVSIGSDAVYIAEAYWKAENKIASEVSLLDSCSIRQISRKYGSQAIVVSLDPRRTYIMSPDSLGSDCPHAVVETEQSGPQNEKYCWFQCTVKGGREGRDIDVVAVAKACESLGAGEILLNSIDKDGAKNGYDLELLKLVKRSVSIPVIASSGAGKPEHFSKVFSECNVDGALAAGIFHRKETDIEAVKSFLISQNFAIRPTAS